MTSKASSANSWQSIVVGVVCLLLVGWIGWVSLTLIKLELEVAEIHKEILSQRSTIPEVIEKSLAEIRDKDNASMKEQATRDAEILKALQQNTQAIDYINQERSKRK
jgi:predicted Holliday junction resolvase-like endonuclease